MIRTGGPGWKRPALGLLALAVLLVTVTAAPSQGCCAQGGECCPETAAFQAPLLDCCKIAPGVPSTWQGRPAPPPHRLEVGSTAVRVITAAEHDERPSPDPERSSPPSSDHQTLLTGRSPPAA
jgi:hypothetical protein